MTHGVGPPETFVWDPGGRSGGRRGWALGVNGRAENSTCVPTGVGDNRVLRSSPPPVWYCHLARKQATPYYNASWQASRQASYCCDAPPPSLLRAIRYCCVAAAGRMRLRMGEEACGRAWWWWWWWWWLSGFCNELRVFLCLLNRFLHGEGARLRCRTGLRFVRVCYIYHVYIYRTTATSTITTTILLSPTISPPFFS